MASNATLIGAALVAGLAGGLNKPPANWAEVDIRMPAVPHAYRMLDQQGNLSGDSTQGTSAREKISPQDFFRIVELAPKAVRSPAALKEPPAAADSLLHIKNGDGTNYYFAGEQEHFKDGNAQEIWTILRKYRSGAW
ncbi:hypothetical protein FGKAn22_14810 [Ferrigenium kumadai]|uniref:Uncharacterized protein n=1 Tax=Ferrigenium kumadai TaxID=1682490 RepID=A0AAN1SZE5_9PROT|nr:hypothetical protein [Ferrigenium kumadai]BBI99788.1 hypothetical protein FGKAn22_14810 [Ferrigenium kumadai]